MPAGMAGSKARVPGSRTEPQAAGQVPESCLLPEASIAAPLQMKTDSEDIFLLLSISIGYDSCVFNIANSMLLILLGELFEVKRSKIKENNGLNPRLEFSLRQNPTFLSV